jgi:hypothetical protein
MAHIPVPHQQQQLQYAQTNIAPESAQVQQSSPQGHQQHFPMDGQRQQTQSQDTASSLPPQVGGQQIVHPSFPQQQQQQQHQQGQGQGHLNQQLINNPTHEPAAQDPLDIHHEMHATREDQTDI